jgi:predicted Ser/Thr protein kinase/uncharacterized membrane protein affecting hemolysin expression
MDISRLAGTKLGNYEIEKLLGKGGMGVVYKARQISLNRVAAIKILYPILSRDGSFVKRFYREARAVAQLSHPNIVQIYDVAEEDSLHFFSMEYIKGQTVREVLNQGGSLEPSQSLEIVVQVARALECTHGQSIIHRDIKPSNIIIDSLGRAKLMDFGLAKIATETSELTKSGYLLGTPTYMSPEQCRGEELDPRSDIFSLGVVLYEMLTGTTPFATSDTMALMHKIIYDEPPKVRVLNPKVSTGLSNIVARAMAKARKDRYDNISDLLEDVRHLRALQAGEPGPGVKHVETKCVWTAKAIYSILFKRVLRLKPTFGLHSRIAFCICLAILSTAYLLGSLFVRMQTGQLLSVSKEKGVALARTIASASGYGVLAKAPEMFNGIIEGLMQEADIAYAIIYDSEGTVLARTPTLPHHIDGVSDYAAHEVAEQALRTDELLIQTFTTDWRKIPVYDIAAPILVGRKSGPSGEELIFSIGEEGYSEDVTEKIGVLRIGFSLDAVNEEIRQLRRTAMTVTVTVVLLAICISVFLVRRITNPVRRRMDSS